MLHLCLGLLIYFACRVLREKSKMGSQKEDNLISKSIGILRIVPATAGLCYFLCLSLQINVVYKSLE